MKRNSAILSIILLMALLLFIVPVMGQDENGGEGTVEPVDEPVVEETVNTTAIVIGAF